MPSMPKQRLSMSRLRLSTLCKSSSTVRTFSLHTPHTSHGHPLDLNTPKSSYHSLRPHGIINALSSPPPPPLNSNSPTTFYPSTSSSLFNSREHQDAQELFQLVSECIKNEMTAVDREGLRDRGIAGVLALSTKPGKKDPGTVDEMSISEPRNLNSKSVFDGLTANRRSCVMCGYTEAVMHFGFDNWQLAVPRLAVCFPAYHRVCAGS